MYRLQNIVDSHSVIVYYCDLNYTICTRMGILVQLGLIAGWLAVGLVEQTINHYELILTF